MALNSTPVALLPAWARRFAAFVQLAQVRLFGARHHQQGAHVRRHDKVSAAASTGGVSMITKS